MLKMSFLFNFDLPDEDCENSTLHNSDKKNDFVHVNGLLLCYVTLVPTTVASSDVVRGVYVQTRFLFCLSVTADLKFLVTGDEKKKRTVVSFSNAVYVLSVYFCFSFPLY